MHTSFAKRCAILEGLRERTRKATADFYQKPGIQPPPLAPLIIVRPSGNNTFSLINRAIGVVVAERFGHNNATKHAHKLEAKAALFGIKKCVRIMRDWVLRIGAILAAFALLGSQA